MITPTATPLPRMSGSNYVPKVGDTITIELPDERTRGTIERVISDVAAIARLQTFTTGVGKSHNYRKDDLVPCRFERLGMNVAGWRAVSEREMDEAAAARVAKDVPSPRRVLTMKKRKKDKKVVARKAVR